jgi:hypothetical protein
MKIFLLLFLFIYFSTNLFSQGMNNDFPLDSTDIKIQLSMLGLEAFKFPIKKVEQKCYLKISILTYENNKLISTNEFTKAMPKVDKEYNLSLDSIQRLIRIYDHEINDSSYTINININNISYLLNNTVSGGHCGLHQCRAYSDYQPVKGQEKPIFIRYSVEKGKPMIHCPGNAPLETVAKLYPSVIAVVVSLEELE